MNLVDAMYAMANGNPCLRLRGQRQIPGKVNLAWLPGLGVDIIYIAKRDAHRQARVKWRVCTNAPIDFAQVDVGYKFTVKYHNIRQVDNVAQLFPGELGDLAVTAFTACRETKADLLGP